MRRIPTTLAAMVAAAAVTAAITIPAVAQSGGSTLTSCLSAHGVDVPAGLDGVALKQWLADRQNEPGVAACIGGPQKDELYSCLKAHGVDVPNDPYAIKRKVAELAQTDAGKATLSACHIDVGDRSGCGGGKPAQYPGESAKKE